MTTFTAIAHAVQEKHPRPPTKGVVLTLDVEQAISVGLLSYKHEGGTRQDRVWQTLYKAAPEIAEAIEQHRRRAGRSDGRPLTEWYPDLRTD